MALYNDVPESWRGDTCLLSQNPSIWTKAPGIPRHDDSSPCASYAEAHGVRSAHLKSFNRHRIRRRRSIGANIDRCVRRRCYRRRVHTVSMPTGRWPMSYDKPYGMSCAYINHHEITLSTPIFHKHWCVWKSSINLYGQPWLKTRPPI